MICTAQNSEFIEKILSMSPSKVRGLIDQEDQKFVLRKKQEIIRNMPQILKPNQNQQAQNKNYARTFYNSNFLDKKKDYQQRNIHFPSKFQQKSRNKMLLSKSTSQKQQRLRNLIPKENNSPFTFESGIKEEFLEWKGQKLPVKITQENLLLQSQVKPVKIQQNQIKFDDDKQISFKRQPVQTKRQDKQFEKVEQLMQKNQQLRNFSKEIIQNPFAPPLFQQSKNSPFISNKTNFLDLHTNKKSQIGNYLSPEVYSMNMLQYAHNKKQQNTFDDRYSYPNVIMGGSGHGWMKTAQQMRENPFQKTFISGSKGFYNTNKANQKQFSEAIKQSVKLEANNQFRQNVRDTLKYTLGDRRLTSKIADKTNDDNYKSNGFEGLVKKEAAQNRTKIIENPFVRRPSSTFKN